MARTRTFLAVDLGAAVRARIVDVQKTLAATGAAVKWVEPANLHITLQFLGELDDRDLAQIGRLTSKAVADIEPFRISVSGLGAFPNLRRPKVLWAGINDGAEELVALFNALEVSLDAAGLNRREVRAYTPHVTLGRAKDEEAGALIAPELAQYRDWTAGITTVEEVQILASDLRRSGPEYTVMGRARLQ